MFHVPIAPLGGLQGLLNMQMGFEVSSTETLTHLLPELIIQRLTGNIYIQQMQPGCKGDAVEAAKFCDLWESGEPLGLVWGSHSAVQVWPAAWAAMGTAPAGTEMPVSYRYYGECRLTLGGGAQQT